MSPVEQILVGTGGMSLAMAALWGAAQVRKDASVVDVGWSAGIGILAVFFAASGEAGGVDPTWVRWLPAGLAAAWSARLTGHLWKDRVWGKEEDGRYRTLRKNWAGQAGFWFFWFFQAQGLLAVLFAAPPWIAMHHGRVEWSVWETLGTAVWCAAAVGEAAADRQLAGFRADPANKGRTCREGLWRYSRHPNYFFEWLHWWCYVLLAVGADFWWATLGAPLLMWVFLFKITGIPATEAQAVLSRGDDYRRYQETTSVFVPWFPKKP